MPCPCPDLSQQLGHPRKPIVLPGTLSGRTSHMASWMVLPHAMSLMIPRPFTGFQRYTYRSGEGRHVARAKGRVLFEGTLDLRAEMVEPLSQGPMTVQSQTYHARIKPARTIQHFARADRFGIVKCELQ